MEDDHKEQKLKSKPIVDILPADERKMNNLSNLSLSIELKYVKLGYHYLMSNAMHFVLLSMLGMIFAYLSTSKAKNLTQLQTLLMSNPLLVILCSASIFIANHYFLGRPSKVYLLDFACYKPKSDYKCSGELFMRVAAETKCFTEESLAFQKKIMEKSGYGPMTYAPKGLLRVPRDQSMAATREETEIVMFGAIDELLAKTGVKPRDIGILVVNSSMFNPTPSLSATIVNRYKLRGNILSYNLGRMGCSAGMISIDLASDLLLVHRHSCALVVSTENITCNWYLGSNKSMLLTNCLFRMGGAAILLSNRSSDRHQSKYQLVHAVRSHKGTDDKSYKSVYQEEDNDQILGISLSKELMAVAGEALKVNIVTLGPLVLPLSQQFLFLASLVAAKWLKLKIKPYIPDFKLAFEHFCIHAGGRGVLDEIEKSLKLTEWHTEPSRMTLYRFGNTSSSSVWYQLAYCEAKGRVKKGDRIWQIGFGSGFKCNSVVWRATRNIKPIQEKNPWMDEIDDFPVYVPKVSPIDF